MRYGRGFAASKTQREKVRHEPCACCGNGPCDPAHLISRSLCPTDADDPRAVIPLCRPCHRAYDEGFLDLLGALEPRYREELSFAVLRFGLVSTYRRVTGSRSLV